MKVSGPSREDSQPWAGVRITRLPLSLKEPEVTTPQPSARRGVVNEMAG